MSEKKTLTSYFSFEEETKGAICYEADAPFPQGQAGPNISAIIYIDKEDLKDAFGDVYPDQIKVTITV